MMFPRVIIYRGRINCRSLGPPDANACPRMCGMAKPAVPAGARFQHCPPEIFLKIFSNRSGDQIPVNSGQNGPPAPLHACAVPADPYCFGARCSIRFGLRKTSIVTFCAGGSPCTRTKKTRLSPGLHCYDSRKNSSGSSTRCSTALNGSDSTTATASWHASVVRSSFNRPPSGGVMVGKAWRDPARQGVPAPAG